VPRINCPEHGVHLLEVPWARKGSGFTILFEQLALSLVREMPLKAAARHIEVTDKRLWRVVHRYVEKAVNQFVPSSKGTTPWLSNKQELHHDDLYDCQPSGRGTKQWLTHSKPRGAKLL